MAISHVGTNGDTPTTTVTSVTPTLPAGVTTDDLIVVCTTWSNSTVTDTTPTGYTLLVTDSDGTSSSSAKGSVYYKVAGASESNPTVGLSGSVRTSWGIHVFRGVDTTNPWISSTTLDFPGTQPFDITTTNGVDANAWAVGDAGGRGWGVASGCSYTITGSTERYDSDPASGTTGRIVGVGWDSNGSVGSTSDFTVTIGQNTSTSTNGFAWLGLLKPASGGLTAVDKTLDTAWNLRTLATKAQQVDWNVRAAVTKVRDFAWNVFTTVPTKTLSTAWNIRTAIAKTRDFAWNVAGVTLSAITKTLDTAWTVRALVNKTRDFNWNIRTSVSKTQASNWNIRSLVTKTVNSQWNIRQAVEKIRDFMWGVAGSLAISQQIQWNVRTAVVKTRQINWNVTTAVTKTRDFAWSIIGKVEVVFDFAWSLTRLWHRVEGATNGWEFVAPEDQDDWQKPVSVTNNWTREQ